LLEPATRPSHLTHCLFDNTEVGLA
jgi:hypothetical protein